MQTFLPYPEFDKSAKCLDYRRLGKQRVEAKQILNVLDGKTTAWGNHPAVKMWQGYRNALAVYHNVIIDEWIKRGYKNNMPMEDVARFNIITLPNWIGGPIHASHRSNLLKKDFSYYSQFGWSEPDNIPYVWPSKENQ